MQTESTTFLINGVGNYDFPTILHGPRQSCDAVDDFPSFFGIYNVTVSNQRSR